MSEISREQVSALLDGELSDAEADAVLSALRSAEEMTDWSLYHQIGDAIRSDELAIPLSPNFAQNFSARFAAEPIHLAPPQGPIASRLASRQWRYLPQFVAAAAVASFAFLVAPFVVDTGAAGDQGGEVVVQADSLVLTEKGMVQLVQSESEEMMDREMMHDPRMEEYLIAHQRSAPSFYRAGSPVRTVNFSGN